MEKRESPDFRSAEVGISALFIIEDPKNFSIRTVWRNAKNTQ